MGSIGIRTLIFAKAPVPGQVKTRLASVIGAQPAAALYRQLLNHCIGCVQSAKLGEAVLFVAPALAADALLKELAQTHGLPLLPQQGDDIGARMAHALRWSLADATPTLLIGSDCGALTPDYLRAAAAALGAPNDVVLGPAEDGGYFLVGARTQCPDLFSGIEWSTPRVLEQTRRRLRQTGLRWHELAATWDVDEPRDLARLAQLDAFRAWRSLLQQGGA